MMPMVSPAPDSPRSLGRYVIAGPIAVGGMASVHFGRLEGPSGFKRPVAIKRMLAAPSDVEARTMLLDEARLASRIQHTNVVQTLDVIEEGPELFIVLEYVHGESFEHLQQRARANSEPCPPRIVGAVLAGALRGLHAAHEVKGDDGQLLDLVHRDFSPQNVLVGADGVSRVLDFGVARARGRMQGTRDGQLKGKLAYLSPEQVHGEASRQSDVFAAGIVLWEALTSSRLFDAPSEAEVLSKVLLCRVPSLEDALAPWQPIVDRALQRDPSERFSTALEMAAALEQAGVASNDEVASWVAGLAGDAIEGRGHSLEALQQWSVPASAKAVAPPPKQQRSALVFVVPALLVAGGALALFAARQPQSVPAPAVIVTPRALAAPPVPKEPEPPAPKPASKPPSNVRPAADACNPPFTIGANGVKQFKVECLK
jgi:serine/threonine protein kinase